MFDRTTETLRPLDDEERRRLHAELEAARVADELALMRADDHDAARRALEQLSGGHRSGRDVASEDAAPPEPDERPPGSVRVRVCTTEPRGRGMHVVDEDAPAASLCGREVAAIIEVRKVRKPCPGCRRELRARIDAGEWEGPRP